MFIFYLGSFKLKRGGEGANRTTRTPAAEERVLNAVDENPSSSVRKLSGENNITKSVVHRILLEQLLHPFHIQKVHAMTPDDYPARLQYATWFLRNQRRNNFFISNIMFTDEAGFGRDGVINSHNLHLWHDENPHEIIQSRHQHRFFVNVWAGIIGNHLIGPFILHDRLNGARYLQFLQGHLNDLLEDVPVETRYQMWYMHDGAPPHFDILVRQHLTNTFGDRWIGRGGPFLWPPRSPDLNPLDFFFWGYLKGLVYATPVNSREELIQRIIHHSDVIRNNHGTLFQVQRNSIKRLKKCMDVHGGHIENLL